MTRALFLSILLLLVSLITYGQTAKGYIMDANLQPIPYATIFVPSLTTGTTTNQEGYFELELPLGVYDVEFRSMGYKTAHQSLSFPYSGNNLQVILFENKIEIKEVRVFSGNEDPAYAIMRKAIAHAPYYFKQVESYDAEIYLKGIARVLKLPKLLSKAMEVEGESVKEGHTFYEESMNHIHFKAPDHYTQEVTAIKSTFAQDNADMDPMAFITTSLYDPDSDVAISPLSKKALHYYKFRYDGFYYEGDNTVNKIFIQPKRKNPEAFTGYVYIVEGTWNLHAVDLRLDQFWGFVEVKQQYAIVKQNLWMPISYDFKIKGGMLGMSGEFEYHTAVKYSDIIENTTIQVPSSIAAVRAEKEEETEPIVETKEEKKLEMLLQKEELTTRDMIRVAKLMEKQEKKGKEEKRQELQIVSNYKVKVDSLATKRDSSFWKAIRPVPLTGIENNEFSRSDSLVAVHSNNPEDLTSQKGVFLSKLAFGSTVINNENRFKLYYNGLLNPELNDYTAVDGISIQQKFDLTWKLDSVDYLEISPQAGYAFSSEEFLWQVHFTRSYAPLSRGIVSLSTGQQTRDFNTKTGMNRTVDVMSTMFWKENIRRFYHSDFVKANNSVDVSNGLRVSTTFEWENRTELVNTYDHSFSGKSRPYRANTPNNEEVESQQLSDSKKTAFQIGVYYTPRQHYRIKKGKKYSEGSDFPTFWANYQKAIPKLFNSDANFQLLQLGIKQNCSLGYFSELDYSLSTGSFLGSTPEHFSDFVHFNTLQSPVGIGSLEHTIHLLDNYQTSTANKYANVAANFSTSYLALKYLPFLSKRLLQESVSINTVFRDEIEPYVEVGYGLTDIFLILDLGIYGGFQNHHQPLWGFKVGIKVNQ